jgi:hypothetical protein
VQAAESISVVEIYLGCHIHVDTLVSRALCCLLLYNGMCLLLIDKARAKDMVRWCDVSVFAAE